MKVMFRAMVLGTQAVVLLGLVFVSTASAQCVFPAWDKTGGISPQASRSPAGSPSGAFVAASKNEGAGGQIVGFWKVKFVSEGTPGIPDDMVIDNGFAQWHSDGTEIMNSSRAPATQSFCLGVYEKSGPSSYDLNHFALSFDPAGNSWVPRGSGSTSR